MCRARQSHVCFASVTNPAFVFAAEYFLFSVCLSPVATCMGVIGRWSFYFFCRTVFCSRAWQGRLALLPAPCHVNPVLQGLGWTSLWYDSVITTPVHFKQNVSVVVRWELGRPTKGFPSMWLLQDAGFAVSLGLHRHIYMHKHGSTVWGERKLLVQLRHQGCLMLYIRRPYKNTALKKLCHEYVGLLKNHRI